MLVPVFVKALNLRAGARETFAIPGAVGLGKGFLPCRNAARLDSKARTKLS